MAPERHVKSAEDGRTIDFDTEQWNDAMLLQVGSTTGNGHGVLIRRQNAPRMEIRVTVANTES